MTAGTLKSRIDLITAQRTSDGAGGWTRGDTVETTVWGRLRSATYSEQQRGDKLEQRVQWVIVIRWQPDLARGFGPSARARITDAGGAVRELTVHTVGDPDGRRRFLELSCSEGGPA